MRTTARHRTIDYVVRQIDPARAGRWEWTYFPKAGKGTWEKGYARRTSKPRPRASVQLMHSST